MSEERVKLVRELSRSGVATVWEGWDNSLDRKVLVKSIHPQFARDADLRIRFEREARAIARLSHPNVVQIYDIQSGDDSLSLMLEFIEGETLGSLLKRRGVLPYGLALRVTTEILAGLEAAHANGIIHRDLKPDNILIARNGAVKITDFGLASLRDLPAVTQEGMVVGTPSYMSPEQALGGDTGPQTDLFTCGAMFFEMMTGTRLIQGENLGEAFQNVMKYKPPDLNIYAQVIPANARKILEELIERDPAQRPRSASVVRNALLSEPQEYQLTSVALASFLTGDEMTKPVIIVPRAHSHTKRWYAIATSIVLVAVLALIFSMLDFSPEQPVISKPIPTPVDTSKVAKIDTVGATQSAPSKPLPKDTTSGRKPIQPPDTTKQAPVKIELPKQSGPAYATITSTPWARVFYNDSLLGTTPLMAPLKLPAGQGTLLFLNDQVKLPVSRAVDLKAGDTTEIALNLQESIARLKISSVRPWADVYVDGEMKFRTPSTQVLFLPLGKHKLELRHPEFPTYTKDLIFQAGDPIYEVRVDLTKL
ncbi:MAG: serine/threonine protein kinase [bacterium]|nr:serine/threonine protein kinase [bacterium]